jgi:hypothetical protein
MSRKDTTAGRGTALVRGRRAPFFVALFAFFLVSVSAASAGTARRVVTVYSVATGLQYINTADDRARGKVNNPLDSAASKLMPKSAGRNGPFAGDVAVYALKLYADSSLGQQTGSAVYTCYFNYDRHALCQAYYKLPGGSTLVASGPIDFNSSKFTIVVSGGTKTYLGARGQAKVVPAPHGAQRIEFELLK